MAMTQQERHSQGNWTTGYDLYMDGCPRTMCENKDQERGWDDASNHEGHWLKVEASILARQEEVHVL